MPDIEHPRPDRVWHWAVGIGGLWAFFGFCVGGFEGALVMLPIAAVAAGLAALSRAIVGSPVSPNQEGPPPQMAPEVLDAARDCFRPTSEAIQGPTDAVKRGDELRRGREG